MSGVNAIMRIDNKILEGHHTSISISWKSAHMLQMMETGISVQTF
jgi:hypothetical protein